MNVTRTGGEETEIGILARYLDRRRVKMSVLSCWGVNEDAPVMNKLSSLGVEVDTACHNMPEVADKTGYIIGKIRREKIRVVVACQDTRIAYNLFMYLSPSECRLIEHGGIVAEAAAIPKEHTALYIGVSKAIRDEAAKLMQNKQNAIFMPSMVDTELFESVSRVDLRKRFGFPENSCVISFVGRLDPKKRIEQLIKAAEIILPAYPNALFLIVGGPDAYQPDYALGCFELAKSLIQTNRFIFAGSRSDVHYILSASDILVLASIGEGMSHVINEAGAAGLAVVATNDGAAAEQLDNGECGVLVSCNDHGSLVTELKKLIDDREKRVRLGERLKAKVSREYSAKVLVPKWESLVAQVAEGTYCTPGLRIINEDTTIPFPMVNRAGNVKNFDMLNYAQISSNPVRICELVFNKMFILYNGDVVLCCMDWRRKVVLGNLYKESIKDIWHGEKYNRIRRLHKEGRLKDIGLCSKCSYTFR